MLFLDGALNEPHLLLQVEVPSSESPFIRGLFSGATAMLVSGLGV